MRGIVFRLNLLRSRQTKDIQARLARAGWRSRDALVIYLFCRLCLPFLTGAAALFVLYGLEPFTLQPMMKLVGVIGAMSKWSETACPPSRVTRMMSSMPDEVASSTRY